MEILNPYSPKKLRIAMKFGNFINAYIIMKNLYPKLKYRDRKKEFKNIKHQFTSTIITN